MGREQHVTKCRFGQRKFKLHEIEVAKWLH